MKKNITIIGDVHGKIKEYEKITQQFEYTVQIGDFGFHKEHKWHINNIDGNKHKILFGNHDYYPYLYKEYSLGDYHYDENDIFYIRGANSIDKKYRTEGLDWFRNEELNTIQSNEIIDVYSIVKPKYVVSHECPYGYMVENINSNYIRTSTSMLLNELLDIHKPKTWVYGHYHKSMLKIYKDIEFIGLDELETVTIEI